MANQGDKYIFHSKNGMNYYIIEIINVNRWRPPEVIYACDIIDDNGVGYYESYGDWYFCGDDLIDKCEKINKKGDR